MKTILTCTLLAALSFWVLPGRTMARETREEDLVLLVEQAPSGMEQTMAAPAEAKVYTPAAEQAEHETNIRLLCNGEVLELPLETILQDNLDKLKKRYPDGFAAKNSRERTPEEP